MEAETLRTGLTDAGTRRPDLIILDLGLPDGDGMEFLRELRGWSRVGEQDKIEALDAGADDYLTKPFRVGELLARVRAARRRHDSGAVLEAEYRLLTLLVANSGKVLTHRQILREVWASAPEARG